MEVDAKIDPNDMNVPEFLAEDGGEGETGDGKKAIWAEILTSMPGIDEILVFTEVIR